MKFIFPKNYNYNLKLLGTISYSTAIINLVIGLVIFGLVNILFKSLSLKIYFFIGLYLPIFMFTIFGINKESFVNVARYMFKFFKNRKVYLYRK